MIKYLYKKYKTITVLDKKTQKPVERVVGAGDIIGVLVADRQPNLESRNQDKIVIGYSLLNRKDVEDIKAKNNIIRQVNGKLYKEGKKEQVAAYLPLFDRKEALELAKSRLQSEVNLASLPSAVKKSMPFFVRRATKYFKGLQVNVK